MIVAKSTERCQFNGITTSEKNFHLIGIFTIHTELPTFFWADQRVRDTVIVTIFAKD
jgi:hypothetical protein